MPEAPSPHPSGAVLRCSNCDKQGTWQGITSHLRTSRTPACREAKPILVGIREPGALRVLPAPEESGPTPADAAEEPSTQPEPQPRPAAVVRAASAQRRQEAKDRGEAPTDEDLLRTTAGVSWIEPSPEEYAKGMVMTGEVRLRLDPACIVRFNAAKTDPDPKSRLDATCDLAQYLSDCSETVDLVRRRKLAVVELPERTG